MAGGAVSLTQLVSGAQTGVDRGALDAALDAGFPCGGWCPSGRRAEDGPIPDRYPVHPLAAGGYRERTLQNVIDSDATLILYFTRLHGGTEQTWRDCASRQRPCRLIDAAALPPPRAAGRAARFIHDYRVSVLNVAGPRASDAPQGQAYAYALIRELLRRLSGPGRRA
jgi:hypothetical protein